MNANGVAKTSREGPTQLQKFMDCIQCCIQFTNMSPNPSLPVVVEMLYGMHAEASERLDVRVPVVERVHVLVQRLRGDAVSLFVYDLVEFDKYCIRQQDPNMYSDTEASCLV